MKPFLLLSIRGEEAAADNEYESFLRFTGLRRGRAAPGQPRAATSCPRSTSTSGRGSSSAAGRGTPATPGDEVGGPGEGRGRDRAACSTRSSPATSRSSGPATASARWAAPGRGGRPQLARAGRAAVRDADRRRARPIRSSRVCPSDFAAYGGHKEAMATLPERRRPARHVGGLPGAGVPGGQQRLRHAVPPRARPRRGRAPGSTSTRTPATSRPSEAETLKERSGPWT